MSKVVSGSEILIYFNAKASHKSSLLDSVSLSGCDTESVFFEAFIVSYFHKFKYPSFEHRIVIAII